MLLLFIQVGHAEVLTPNVEFENATKALAMELPEVAVVKFKELLKSDSLEEEERKKIYLYLAEAQIRSFDGVGAYKTLDNPILAEVEDRSFWVAHAFFAMGRLAEAVELFEFVVAEKSEEKKGLSLLALSELYRVLNEPEKAFNVLTKAAEMSALSDSASLQLTEFYLFKGKVEEAQKTLEKYEPKIAVFQQQKKYLQAKINLTKGELDQALRMLDELRGKANFPKSQVHLVHLAYSDALSQSGKTAEAVEYLVEHIDGHVDSPYLYYFFNQLLIILQQNKTIAIEEVKVSSWLPKVDKDNEDIVKKDRGAYAGFLLAYMYLLDGDPLKLNQAVQLLGDLRKGYPSHHLTSKSYELESYCFLKLGKIDDVLKALRQMKESAISLADKARSDTLLAHVKFKDGKLQSSKELFLKVGKMEISEYQDNAKIGLSIIAMSLGNSKDFIITVDQVVNEKVRIALHYEAAMKWLVELGDVDSLEKTLKRYPSHPMADNARVMLARKILNVSDVNIEKVEGLINEISANAGVKTKEQADELRDRILIQQEKWEELIPFLEAKNKEGGLDAVRLVSLAEAYYRNGEFVNARREFNKIIQTPELKEFHEFAYFFSAISARKEGTPQGKEESISIFYKILTLKGKFVEDATAQLARMLIDSGKEIDAITVLLGCLESEKTLENSKNKAFPLIRLLYAEALQRIAVQQEGEGKYEYLKKSIKQCELVLKETDSSDITLLHQALFMKGQAQEKVLELKTSALTTYFSIVNLEYQAEKNTPQEWEWYYKAGYRVVEILEEQKRYAAAIKLLNQMANTLGPKSNTLIEKMEKLKLENLIW